MIKVMKTTFALFTIITLASAALAVEVGKPAPDFSATDINGKTVKLNDYKGKIVVLESYNSDCPFCNNQYKTGAMQQLEKDMAAKGVAHRQFRQPQQSQPSHTRPGQTGNRRQENRCDGLD